MRKIILGIALFLLILTPISKAGDYGTYGDGTAVTDTVYMWCTFWDTLGFGAYPDSFHCIRTWHGVRVDSVRETGTTYKISNATAEVVKRAYDGSHYSHYSVLWRFWKDTKLWERGFVYEVIAGYPLDTLHAVHVTAQAVKAKTDNLPDDPADDSDIDAQLLANRDSTHEVHVTTTAVKAKTDNLPTDPADDSDIDAQLLANRDSTHEVHVSALATRDSTHEVHVTVSGIDDNQWDNPKSDTASGMGDWFADWYNASLWLTSSGDTNNTNTDIALIKDTVFAVLDTLQAGFGSRSAIGDTNNTNTDIGLIKDSTFAILDTLQAGFGSRSAIGDTIGREASVAGDAMALTGAERETSAESIWTWQGTITLKDTARLQGAASGLTKEDIATCVRDTAENRPDIWTDQAGGTGTEKETLIVLNGDTATVEGVSITIFNTSGTVVATGITDVNGKDIFSLDVATYIFSLQRIGVIHSEDDTIVITADGTDTIWVISYDIGSPPSGDVTRIKGFTRTYGFKKTDRVTISFSTHDENLIDTTTGVFIDKIAEKTYSDTGYFEIDVIPSIHLLSKTRGDEKDSIRYDVLMTAPGRQIFEYLNIFVPDTSGAVWLKDILED